MERANGQACGSFITKGSVDKDNINIEASIAEGQPHVPGIGQERVLGESEDQEQEHSEHIETDWTSRVRGCRGIRGP
jgi:hypothetical protein